MLNHSIVDFIDIVGVGKRVCVSFHLIFWLPYTTQTLIPKTTHLTNSVASYIVLICPFISNNSTLETMYWQNTINDLSAQKSMMTKWHAVQRTYWSVCVYSIYDVHKKNTQRLFILYIAEDRYINRHSRYGSHIIWYPNATYNLKYNKIMSNTPKPYDSIHYHRQFNMKKILLT